ncbi:MAG: polyprenyl synthetase family protein [Candidatus Nanopelagicales bacterium]|jgi:heptaprenyl diphosphate synthase|nr:polyprenyl synthetase family protein [Candidatus Nanopelagicales bacterium]MDP4824619.1 polyprenyl synthetase family protein [Candidatus Nanopelagicales bacterium]MDP4888326.1 polyprenyl synthetase family protein [Candidatus Nanopelagicales bacterium]
MSPRIMTSMYGLGIDSQLADQMADGLARVETGLREAVRSDYPFVTEASRHLVDAGGKRFRPLLVLLAAQYGDPRSVGVVPAAIVVELTHLATLYHDDVMDEADLRRGASSANARWSNTVAILTGDFLFARASEILADLGPDAVRIQARTFERLCTGQIRETVGPAEGADPVDHHLQVLADKTGSLIATSCQFGALMSGADAQTTATLTRFGEHIGVAFQLADDLVDITSDSAQSGKTPGTDLREGVPTLAALMAMRANDDPWLVDALSRPLHDEVEHGRALSALRAHPALIEAQNEARRWADSARSCLDGLSDDPATEALRALCDYVVNRTG